MSFTSYCTRPAGTLPPTGASEAKEKATGFADKLMYGMTARQYNQIYK
ncbi:hypothetical protein [Sansalvadorimonas verongulae]|nr:hypothetical protein [Sansalvadorimonas verongulae]